MLRIWGRTSSVNVQKVMWCIGELGVAHERLDAGLEHRKNDEDWYLALNPNGKVPLLEDGHFSLWESNTIVRYLCAKHDFGGLYPASLETRAHAERWMDWQLSTVAKPAAIAFWNIVRTPAAERDMHAVARAVEEVNGALTLLDRHLAQHEFVAGEQLSIGDIPVGAIAHRWLALPGIERPELPALQRWYRSLTQRSAFRAHVMLPLR